MVDVYPKIGFEYYIKIVFCNSLISHSCMWLNSVISKACEKRHFYAIAVHSKSTDGAEGGEAEALVCCDKCVVEDMSYDTCMEDTCCYFWQQWEKCWTILDVIKNMLFENGNWHKIPTLNMECHFHRKMHSYWMDLKAMQMKRNKVIPVKHTFKKQKWSFPLPVWK